MPGEPAELSYHGAAESVAKRLIAGRLAVSYCVALIWGALILAGPVALISPTT